MRGRPIFTSPPVAYPVAGGPATSPAFTPTAAGTYRWRATYSGDANNDAVTGACNAADENVVVTPNTPTIATTASPNITLGAGTLTDTATVSGRVEPAGGCDDRRSGSTARTTRRARARRSSRRRRSLSGGRWPGDVAGVHADGGGHLSLARDLQRRRQQRPGLPVRATRPTRTSSWLRLPPTIATTASPTIDARRRDVTDTATVTGRVNPLAGATIDFRLYGPDDATCATAIRCSRRRSPIRWPVAR